MHSSAVAPHLNQSMKVAFASKLHDDVQGLVGNKAVVVSNNIRVTNSAQDQHLQKSTSEQANNRIDVCGCTSATAFLLCFSFMRFTDTALMTYTLLSFRERALCTTPWAPRPSSSIISKSAVHDAHIHMHGRKYQC